MQSADFQRLLRRERDSNPRYSCPYTAFRVRPDRPLRHLSLSFGSANIDIFFHFHTFLPKKCACGPRFIPIGDLSVSSTLFRQMRIYLFCSRLIRLYSGANTKRGTVFVTMTGTERMQRYMRYEKNKNHHRNIGFGIGIVRVFVRLLPCGQRHLRRPLCRA